MSDTTPSPSVRAGSLTRVMVFGARGRMGEALRNAIAAATNCTLAASVDRGDEVPRDGVDLVIDFSSDKIGRAHV